MKTMKIYPKISISGDIGSGKSAVCKTLSKILSFRIVSTGDLQRKYAKEHNMSITEFNKYMELHPEIDREIDNITANIKDVKECLLLDSRMAWYFIPTSFKIHLIVDINIATERILKDEIRISEFYKDKAEAKKNIVERKNSENIRFCEQYKVNCPDFNNYDLVIETSYATPDEIAKLIIDKFYLWLDHISFNNIWLSPKSLFPTQNIKDLSGPKTKALINNIKESGFNETSAIEVVRVNNYYFINDGHKRTSAALLNNIPLIPVKIIGADEDTIFDSISIRHHISKCFNLSQIYDWEDAHKFSFSEYPIALN